MILNLPKRSFAIFVICLAFLVCGGFAYSYYSPGSPAGFVNDFTQTLSQEQKQNLESKLFNFEKETSNEIAVAIIPNMKGDYIENFADKLFEEWGIGKEDKDNGVLILIAKEDREMRIEVGYGLEGALTDSQAYWIIQNVTRPAFQAEDYYAGIDGAADKIIAATKGEYVPSESPKNRNGFKVDFDLIWFGLFFLVWMSSIFARSKSWWAGGVVGLIIGIILIFFTSWLIGLIAALFLTPLGFLLDYFVSKNYQNRKSSGRPPSWWAGGFGGSHLASVKSSQGGRFLGEI